MYTFLLSNNQYDNNGNRIENKTVSTLGNEVVMYFPDRLHLDENKKYENTQGIKEPRYENDLDMKTTPV